MEADLWAEEGCGPEPADERVLVAVVPRAKDWELIRTAHWYRLPVERAPRRLGAAYLAFYHTQACGALRWSIRYYAAIRGYRLARRRDLLPDEPDHPHADQLYYRIELGPLQTLPRPIPSRKLRRITFIHTTLARLLAAQEVNDLWRREPPQAALARAWCQDEDAEEMVREARAGYWVGPAWAPAVS